jgi:hypothetical protein
MPAFAETAYVTVPEPDPELPPVIVIQALAELAVHEHPAGAVTEIVPFAAPEGRDAPVGAMEYVHGAPAWVIVTDWPATVMTPSRGMVDVLGATVYDTVPFPLPLVADVMVIQETLLEAVHAHAAAFAVTAMLPVPPACVGVVPVGVMEKLQTTPACVIVKAWSAIVTVAVRPVVSGLAATLYATVPLPFPLPPVIETHEAADVAVQAHPEGIDTETVPVEGSAATETPVGESTAVHGTPSCVMVNVWPAIVTVPVLGAVVELAEILYETVPLPVPLQPPITAIHGAPLAAVHPQPVPAVTETVPVRAEEETEMLLGEMLNVQPAACVMVNVCPATVSVPVREAVVVLAATE